MVIQGNGEDVNAKLLLSLSVYSSSLSRVAEGRLRDKIKVTAVMMVMTEKDMGRRDLVGTWKQSWSNQMIRKWSD